MATLQKTNITYPLGTRLDFSEIPPARPPSADTEAWEKFAKQFFETVFGATIEKVPGRGADDGADIIATVKNERLLVSCKHYLNSAVGRDAEIDPKGACDEHGCSKFVGFYSGSASNGLVRKLSNIQKNNMSFRYEIMNGRDIEAELLSHQETKTWLLAMRWFPKSYFKLFSSLVHPIEKYGQEDTNSHQGDGRMSVGKSRFSVWFTPGDDESKSRAQYHALLVENEAATSQIHSHFFLERIKFVAALFPGCFQVARGLEPNQISPHHIVPSWKFETLCSLYYRQCSLKAAQNLCRIWSFWDASKAATYHQRLRHLHEVAPDLPRPTILSFEGIDVALAQADQESLVSFRPDYLIGDSIGGIANTGSTLERGYFALLLSFSPGGLGDLVADDLIRMRLATRYCERESLAGFLYKAVEGLSPDDQRYVCEKSSSLLDIFTAYRVCFEEERHQLTKILAPQFRSFSEPLLEDWLPICADEHDLARALRFI